MWFILLILISFAACGPQLAQVPEDKLLTAILSDWMLGRSLMNSQCGQDIELVLTDTLEKHNVKFNDFLIHINGNRQATIDLENQLLSRYCPHATEESYGYLQSLCRPVSLTYLVCAV